MFDSQKISSSPSFFHNSYGIFSSFLTSSISMVSMSKLSEKRSTHATLFPIIAFLPILLISLIPTGDHLPIVAGIIVLLGMLFLPFLTVKTE